MKKYIIILSAALLALGACTQFAEETKPALDSVSAPVISDIKVLDDSLTFTITPASGTGFYSYLVTDEEFTPDPGNLLSCMIDGLDSYCFDSKDFTTVTIGLNRLDPNCDYFIYAVGASQKGVLSEVASAKATTTDTVNPMIEDLEVEENVLAIQFSECVELSSEDAVKGIAAKYYNLYQTDEFPQDILKGESCGDAEVEVVIEDNIVAFTVTGIPAGAYFSISYPEGTFVDSFGNPCSAVPQTTFKYDEDEDEVVGDLLWGRIETENWTLTLKDTIEVATNLASPIRFMAPDTVSVCDFDPYVVGSAMFQGKTYTHIYDAAPGADFLWDDEDGFAVAFPHSPAADYPAPVPGDMLTLTIPEGFLYDAFGNLSDELVIGPFLYSYGYTLEDLLGTYTYNTVSYYGADYNIAGDRLVIVKSDYEPKEGKEDPEFDFMITKGSFWLGLPVMNPIYGWFDGDLGIVSIPDFAYFYSISDIGEDEQPTGLMAYFGVCEANGLDTMDFIFSKGTSTTLSLVSGQFAGCYGDLYDEKDEYVDYYYWDVCPVFEATKQETSGGGGTVPTMHMAPGEKITAPGGFMYHGPRDINKFRR